MGMVGPGVGDNVCSNSVAIDSVLKKYNLRFWELLPFFNLITIRENIVISFFNIYSKYSLVHAAIIAASASASLSSKVSDFFSISNRYSLFSAPLFYELVLDSNFDT